MHHHIHIGAGFLFLLFLGIVSVIGIFLWYKSSKRKRENERREIELNHQEAMERIKRGGYSTQSYSRGYRPGSQSPGFAHAYSPSAPTSSPSTVIVDRGSNDMLTGMLMGEMIGGMGHNTTVVNETVIESYSPSSSSSDWSASYDSGGSSYDSGSSDSGFSMDF